MNINDIATLSGTSRSTVSRVLTGNPKVSKETRDRVLKIIEEYNFTPNSIARSLAQGRMNVISVVVPNFINPFYSQVVWYIERKLFEEGFLTFLYCTDNDSNKERLCLDMAMQYNFAGVINISPKGSSDIYNNDHYNCPVVLLNRKMKDFNGDTLTVNNLNAAYIATNHLISLGHRDIAILGAGEDSFTHSERKRGYLKALGDNDIPVNKDFIFTGDLTMDCGFLVGQRFISMGKNAPTAFFCTSDLMAIGLIQYLKKSGIRIPGDLSVVGFDDINMSQLEGISLTTIQQPFEQIGNQAAAMIIQRIEHPEIPRQDVILESKLIIRGSTAKLKMQNEWGCKKSPIKNT